MLFDSRALFYTPFFFMGILGFVLEMIVIRLQFAVLLIAFVLLGFVASQTVRLCIATFASSVVQVLEFIVCADWWTYICFLILIL